MRSQFRPSGAAANIYYRVFQTADGFLAVGALSQSLRLKVLAATGLKDPRFKEDGTFELMPEGVEEWGPKLVGEAEALFASKTTDEWVEIMEKNGVPAGPMYFVDELFEHPQTDANGPSSSMSITSFLGHMRMVGPAVPDERDTAWRAGREPGARRRERRGARGRWIHARAGSLPCGERGALR